MNRHVEICKRCRSFGHKEYQCYYPQIVGDLAADEEQWEEWDSRTRAETWKEVCRFRAEAPPAGCPFAAEHAVSR